MTKTLLASTALAAALAFGAHAQTETAPATDAPLAPVMEGAGTAPVMPEGAWSPVDVATVSADTLIGADIVTHGDERVAAVEDVLITDDGAVESVVARFGGFLGFGANRVLLTPDEIEVMQDASERLVVRTGLTPEAIEMRPEYEG